MRLFSGPGMKTRLLIPLLLLVLLPGAAAARAGDRELGGLPPEKVVRLPAVGEAFIINDLHGSLSDFRAFADRTRVLERLREGEDVWLVVNGDVADVKPGHGQPGGDAAILDILMAAKKSLAESGRENRIVVLLGNHEQEGVALYEALNQGADLLMPRPHYNQWVRNRDFLDRLAMERKNWKDLPPEQQSGALLPFVSQFNFIARMTREHYLFLKGLPLAVRCENGVWIMHGLAPGRGSTNPEYDVLWGRDGDGDDFLAETGGELLINWHTAPNLYGSRMKGSWDKDRGMAVVDRDRVIIAPSYGAGGRSYLKLDLSGTYKTDADLMPGREVFFLK